jgi:isopenicillin N synthase-like dioxygenase
MSLPVVDMSAVSAARSEVDGGHAAVARQIGAACSDLGFFYITGWSSSLTQSASLHAVHGPTLAPGSLHCCVHMWVR